MSQRHASLLVLYIFTFTLKLIFLSQNECKQFCFAIGEGGMYGGHVGLLNVSCSLGTGNTNSIQRQTLLSHNHELFVAWWCINTVNIQKYHTFQSLVCGCYKLSWIILIYFFRLTEPMTCASDRWFEDDMGTVVIRCRSRAWNTWLRCRLFVGSWFWWLH